MRPKLKKDILRIFADMRQIPVTCPVCGTPLRGHPMTGYRCVRCHAFYSARHVRTIRREQFRDLVHQHFGPAPEPAKTEEITAADLIVEDDHEEVERALSEAKAAATHAAQHLDDFVDGAKRLREERAAISEVAAALPIERLRHEPPARAYKAKELLVRVARKKKAAKPRRVMKAMRTPARREKPRIRKSIAGRRAHRR